MKKVALSLISTLAIFGGGHAFAASEVAEKGIIVSCTANGRIVHKEELPADLSYEKRRQIKDAFPAAMCIFLSKNSSEKALYTNRYGFDDSASSDDGLVAALAAISGGQIGEEYPADISRMFSGKSNSTEIIQGGRSTLSTQPTKAYGVVNLTLGIYRDMTMKDILAHWKQMQEGGPTLRRMTPTFDTVANVTVMSIMQVPDALADKVCSEASEKGQGCIAFF